MNKKTEKELKIIKGKLLLKNLSAKRNRKLVYPQPIYDDVYFKGIDWLNSLQ